jgi:hypothetical protein
MKKVLDMNRRFTEGTLKGRRVDAIVRLRLLIQQGSS